MMFILSLNSSLISTYYFFIENKNNKYLFYKMSTLKHLISDNNCQA